MSSQIQIQIQNHVPLPPARQKVRYPLRSMSLGESFVAHRLEAKAVGSAIASLRRYQKKSGYPPFNFVQRREPGTELTRFWRTE